MSFSRAPHRADLVLVHLQEVFPFEEDLTAGHHAGRIGDQPHDAQGGGGFAGAGNIVTKFPILTFGEILARGVTTSPSPILQNSPIIEVG